MEGAYGHNFLPARRREGSQSNIFSHACNSVEPVSAARRTCLFGFSTQWSGERCQHAVEQLSPAHCVGNQNKSCFPNRGHFSEVFCTTRPSLAAPTIVLYLIIRVCTVSSNITYIKAAHGSDVIHINVTMLLF
jgi:hypothetical protein